MATLRRLKNVAVAKNSDSLVSVNKKFFFIDFNSYVISKFIKN